MEHPPAAARRPRVSPMAGAVFTVILWGASFVAAKDLLDALRPAGIIVLRFSMGALFLLALCRMRGLDLRLPREAWLQVAGLGAVGVVVHQMLQLTGLSLTTAVRTGWLIALIPLWSTLLAVLVLRERLTLRRAAGLALGLAGTVLIVVRPGAALPTTAGDLLVLAATLVWSVYSVLGRGLLRTYGSLRVTALSMTIGAALMVPVSAALGQWPHFGAFRWNHWFDLVVLGVGCSGIGYWFWFRALDQEDTAKVSSLLYFEPPVTLFTAVLVLGEHAGLRTLAGGMVILAGVALVHRGAWPWEGVGLARFAKRAAAVAVPCGALFLWGADAFVASSAKGRLYTDPAATPHEDVALVLCTARQGRYGLNLFYRARCEAAVDLYKAGVVRHILVSGDNSRSDYDEPSAMKADLMASGIPESAITLDYAGFRTLDSVVRARQVFGLNRVLIVSQRFHVERALYLARARGLDARGYCAAEVGGAWGLRNRAREVLARAAAVGDVALLDRQPRFPGPPEPIHLAPAQTAAAR